MTFTVNRVTRILSKEWTIYQNALTYTQPPRPTHGACAWAQRRGPCEVTVW